MSAPNYDMSSTWNDQYVPPQLEQEYSLDNTVYSDFATGANTSFNRRQTATAAASQSASFSSFNPAFPQDIHAFTFAGPQPHSRQQSMGQPQNNSSGFLAPPATSQQARAQFSPPSPLYVGTSSAQHVDQMGMSPNMPGGFPSYPQQVPNLRSSPSDQQQAFENHDIDNIYGAGASPPFNAGFSPEQLHMGAPQGLQPQSYFGTAQPDLFNGPSFKRLRSDEGAGYDGEADPDPEEVNANRGEVVKPKPLGACARCKGLKVKCEFKTDPETCKRCLNGGHECIIPGRKKRRPPPKREHLLSQINKQAEEIKRLMAQLEEANKKAIAAQSRPLDAPSPSHSATTESFSFISRITSPEVESDHDVSPVTIKTNADMQDWIAKARESIEAFGGYISMGGPNATREMLAGDDDSEGRMSPVHEESDEIELTVDNADGDDGEAVSGDEGSVSTNKKRQGSTTPERKRLATIPSEAAPFGLLAQMSLHKDRSVRRIKSRSDLGVEEEDEDVGLANDDYFRPSSAVERPLVNENHQPPHILRNGLVTPAEVEKLFSIYWEYMNLSVSLLDPVLYTAQNTYWRSPFLFTVICGIASRYYTARPELYQQAMRYAQLAAGTALIGGQKSVEVVHAYILLALYPVPSRKWEDDRSWIYLGVAIRIAMDLNLHHPNTAKPRNEQHAREMLNRTRAWLNCFNLDRSTGSQYGKAAIISNSDYTANRSDQWWNSSPYNMKGFDIHLAGYNAELTVIARFRAKIHSDPSNPIGFNKNLDIAALASETDDEFARLWETWIARVREHNDPDDIQANFRTGLLRLAYSYARMNVLSFGFQYAFGKASIGEDVKLLWRCTRAAMDVLRAVLEDIGVPHQRTFLKHGPEAQSVFTTFACAFLIKLLHPRYDSYISLQQRVEIREKVEQIIELFGSPEVAIDERHGPKLYARFLQGLLATPAASLDRRLGPRVKAKSESPMAQKLELNDTPAPPRQSISQPGSTRPSVEPEMLPQSQSQSQLGGPSYAPQLTADPLAMPLSDGGMNEFMIQPLPFEELLHSMQSVTDPSAWGDFGAMPGFQWMNQNNNDVAMQYLTMQQA